MLEAPGCETPLSSALIGSTVRSFFHERSLRSASVSEAAAADFNADAAVSNVGTRVIQTLESQETLGNLSENANFERQPRA
jgi:hypothetical protein